jgi:hypothetical protein
MEWSHSKKQIRGALDEALAVGLKVLPTTARGHSWGYIDCLDCTGRFYVWSTPKSADVHARQIRQFIKRHSHPEEGEEES